MHSMLASFLFKDDVPRRVTHFLLDFKVEVFEVSIYLMHPVLAFFPFKDYVPWRVESLIFY